MLLMHNVTYNRSLRTVFLFSISAIYIAPDPDTLQVLILEKQHYPISGAYKR